MKKRITITFLSFTILIGFIVMGPLNVKATDFEGNEEYWREVCSQYITNPAKKKQCVDFQTYLTNKKNTSLSSAADIQAKIDGMQSDILALLELSKTYQTQMDALAVQISEIQASINTMTTNIGIVEAEIVVKENNIETRIGLIKDRMIDLQVNVNTNKYIDFIMGASDLVDMIQRSKWVQTYTDHDNELIEGLNVEMVALEADKVELTRIKETLALQETEITAKQEEVAALKVGNDQIVAMYQLQEAELLAAKNAASAAALTAEANMPSLNFGVDSGGQIILPPIASGGWTRPVSSGYISAGTWYYPGGGAHLGMDFAAPIGTPVYAPANGIVLYANNPVGTNSGFLGNMGSGSGTPIGGGNSVFLLVEVNGVAYTVAIYHNSQDMPVIGQSTVSAGQVIAYVGNSGNTSGPHAHVEITRLYISASEAVSYWNRTKDWSFGTGWGTPGASSSYGIRIQPESIFGR